VSQPTDFDKAWAEFADDLRDTPFWRWMERLVGWLARQRWVLWFDAHYPARLDRWLNPWNSRYWLVVVPDRDGARLSRDADCEMSGGQRA